MKRARTPRPWTIHLFAAILIGAGLWTYIAGLAAVSDGPNAFGNGLINGSLNRDGMIIVLSAQFTIVLIPVIAIWLLASRIAKWIVTAMTVLSAIWMALNLPPLVSILAAIPSYCAVALLFTPSASRWFAADGSRDAETFD